MKCFYLNLLVLAGVTLVAWADVEEQFTVSPATTSHLFSQCIEDANTYRGSLYSVSVTDSVEYIRFDASGNSRAIAWEPETDIADTTGCAFRAYERDALMFKFTSSGCELALDEVYDRTQTSCEGTNVVFITTAYSCVVNDTTLYLGESVEGFCPMTCGKEGMRGTTSVSREYGDGQVFCCPDDKARCEEIVKEKVPMCAAAEFCASYGLRLPTAEDEAEMSFIYDEIAKLSQENETYANTWVGVYKDDNDVWRHMPSNNPVNGIEFGSGGPTGDGRCALLVLKGILTVIPCGGTEDGPFVFICVEPEENAFRSCG